MKVQKKENSKRKLKIPKFLIILIIILFIILTLIFILMLTLKSKIDYNGFTLYVNNKQWSISSEEMFAFNKGELYIEVNPRLYSEFGFEINTINFNEINDGIFEIISENEIIRLTGDANYVQIMNLDSYPQRFIKYSLKNKIIFTENLSFYLSQNDFETIFNSRVDYLKDKKIIKIESLNYIKYNIKSEFSDNAIDEEEDLFKDDLTQNYSALLNDFVIVKDSETKLFGIERISKKDLIVKKIYTEIEYVKSLNQFIVTDGSGNKSIIDSNGNKITKTNYSDINLIDAIYDLYYVKVDEKDGVIDSNGEYILQPIFEKVGYVDGDMDYSDSKIYNPYLFFNKLIPVSNNGLWGFYNIKGDKIVEVQYSDIGEDTENNDLDINKYNLSSSQVTPVSLIDEDGKEDIVIKQKDNEGKDVYGLIDSSGNVIVNIISNGIFRIETPTENNQDYENLIEENQDEDVEAYYLDSSEKIVEYYTLYNNELTKITTL